MSFTQKIIKEYSNKDSIKKTYVDKICSVVFRKQKNEILVSNNSRNLEDFSFPINNVIFKTHKANIRKRAESQIFDILDILVDHFVLPHNFDIHPYIEIIPKIQYKEIYVNDKPSLKDVGMLYCVKATRYFNEVLYLKEYGHEIFGDRVMFIIRYFNNGRIFVEMNIGKYSANDIIIENKKQDYVFVESKLGNKKDELI